MSEKKKYTPEEEAKTKELAQEFSKAYAEALREEQERLAKMPVIYRKDEGMVEVYDDKHLDLDDGEK